MDCSYYRQFYLEISTPVFLLIRRFQQKETLLRMAWQPQQEPTS